MSKTNIESKQSLNFIEQIINDDLSDGLSSDKLRFRFPPEPNGYLHIGHATSICLNFGLGTKYNAPVNLRFDDTNPAKEEKEYVEAIKRDIEWLGFSWDNECYSSDYFEQLYDWAILLIEKGKAYVDKQSSEAMAEQKGTPTTHGVASPHRNQSVHENLAMFEKMKNGKFEEGSCVLRAKIDMNSPNMLMRDPIIYRILKKEHHRTGNDWCIYPMYDWTHGQSDYIEQISHSICTLEFKPHRELYDWFLDQIYEGKLLRPKQREFARRNLSYTVMSKRKLLELVNTKTVTGWDDPRMPTISGLRRRGYTPASIKKFSDLAGISKRDSVTDVSLLEYCIREDLNKSATRVMGVLNPIKVVLTNYPIGHVEMLTGVNNPENPNEGTHQIPFTRELYIEREDFKEVADNKYFRLSLGSEVRLKSAYIIKGESVAKDDKGNITEIQCTCDLDSRSGSETEASKRKVKGTIHWVSIEHAINAEVREYDRLFKDETPDGYQDVSFMEHINHNSLKINKKAYLEPYLAKASQGDKFQFQRVGYFTLDIESSSNNLVFNKIVSLRDTWSNKKTQKDEKLNNNIIAKNEKNTKNPLNEIKKISKKYTNLSKEKLITARADIEKLAHKITYEELEPLLDTAAKKIGTRIGVMICLGVLLKKGLQRNEKIDDFIKFGIESNHELLIAEAKKL